MIILEFEKPIFELETKIKELKSINTGDLSIVEEIKKLEAKLKKSLQKVYGNLSPWQIVQVARHPNRPQSQDYISSMISDFTELAGDRYFGNDKAIIAGIGKFYNKSVAILGHQKGKETEQRIKHNFGMPNPEGYRKARRIMELADKFNIPLLTFIDTAGAYPGVGAEERGQAEAIGKCLEKSLQLRCPIISIIIGEGGSGGAVALAVANTVYMLENSIYSVISPEGCASILWRSADKAEDAANALKLTASNLIEYKLINGIIKEPLGGAHRNYEGVIKNVTSTIKKALDELSPITDLAAHRQRKFLSFGNSINGSN